MIEMLKYMFLGGATYFSEVPPRRLRKNHLWSKESIKAKADALFVDCNSNVEKFIEHLRAERSSTAPRIA